MKHYHAINTNLDEKPAYKTEAGAQRMVGLWSQIAKQYGYKIVYSGRLKRFQVRERDGTLVELYIETCEKDDCVFQARED